MMIPGGPGLIPGCSGPIPGGPGPIPGGLGVSLGPGGPGLIPGGSWANPWPFFWVKKITDSDGMVFGPWIL